MESTAIRSDRRPLYEQAQAAIIAQIVDGVYPPGSQLPREDQLATVLGVSRTTIRSALANLETLGYIQRVHGAGTFVTQGRFRVDAQLDTLESFHPRLAARMGKASRIAHLEIIEMAADAETAEALNLRPGEAVTAITRVVEFDEVPVVFLQDFLRIDLCAAQDLKATFRDSVIDYFDGCNGRPLIEWSNSDFSTKRADTSLAQLLHVNKGDVLLRLDEAFYAADGMLVSWSRNWIVPEYFRFHIRRRVVRGESQPGH